MIALKTLQKKLYLIWISFREIWKNKDIYKDSRRIPVKSFRNLSKTPENIKENPAVPKLIHAKYVGNKWTIREIKSTRKLIHKLINS